METAIFRELCRAQFAPICLFLAVCNVGVYKLCIYDYLKAQKALYATVCVEI